MEVYGEMHRYIPVIAKWAGFNKIGEKVVKHQTKKIWKYQVWIIEIHIRPIGFGDDHVYGQIQQRNHFFGVLKHFFSS